MKTRLILQNKNFKLHFVSSSWHSSLITVSSLELVKGINFVTALIKDLLKETYIKHLYSI